MLKRDEHGENAPCFVVISGCSGGGKSNLLCELARRDHVVVAEPSRRILAEERAGDGSALPWVDAAAFARRALAMSVADHEAAQGMTFFDRGVVDAAVAIVASSGELPTSLLARHRYEVVFLAPPWPEIYVNDVDRRHSFEKALTDFERVRLVYLEASYRPILLPQDSVAARADFVLAHLHGCCAPITPGRARTRVAGSNEPHIGTKSKRDDSVSGGNDAPRPARFCWSAHPGEAHHLR